MKCQWFLSLSACAEGLNSIVSQLLDAFRVSSHDNVDDMDDSEALIGPAMADIRILHPAICRPATPSLYRRRRHRSCPPASLPKNDRSCFLRQTLWEAKRTVWFSFSSDGALLLVLRRSMK
jgi:hypothetical protein